MTVDHRLDLGKAPAQACQAPRGATAIVDEPQCKRSHFQHPLSGQARAQGGLVDVAVHRDHRRAQRLEIIEHGDGAQVTGMDDEIALARQGHATSGQPPLAAREVGVGDDRQAHGC